MHFWHSCPICDIFRVVSLNEKIESVKKSCCAPVMFLEYHTETKSNFKELSTEFAQVHQVGCMDRFNIFSLAMWG